MSRRGSVAPGAGTKPKTSSDAPSKRRGSMFPKDGKQDLPVIKDGDVFYRTVKMYPSLVDVSDEVEISLTRPGMEYVRDTPSVNSSRERRSASDRRTSTIPPTLREDTAEDVTSHSNHRDRYTRF